MRPGQKKKKNQHTISNQMLADGCLFIMCDEFDRFSRGETITKIVKTFR